MDKNNSTLSAESDKDNLLLKVSVNKSSLSAAVVPSNLQK